MAKSHKCGKEVALKKVERWLADLTKLEREWSLACAGAVAKPSGR